MIKFIVVSLLLTACTYKKEIHNHQECRPAKKPPVTRTVGYIDITLIGGEVAEPGQFPATFKTKIGNSWCTGTIIGPRVLQLAAHCVANGGKATFDYAGVDYTATCQRHPAYNGDSTADYALCLVDKEVNVSLYETLTTEEVSLGDTLQLLGFGCVRPGGNDQPDGKLRFGPATVVELPIRDNDIMTEKKAALCYGDSGGAAYMTDSTGILKIAAINSRGDMNVASWLPAVYTMPAKSFYTSWAANKNAYICGLKDIGERCRGYVAPPPPPPPPPEPEPEPIPEPQPEPLPDLPEC